MMMSKAFLVKFTQFRNTDARRPDRDKNHTSIPHLKADVLGEVAEQRLRPPSRHTAQRLRPTAHCREVVLRRPKGGGVVEETAAGLTASAIEKGDVLGRYLFIAMGFWSPDSSKLNEPISKR